MEDAGTDAITPGSGIRQESGRARLPLSFDPISALLTGVPLVLGLAAKSSAHQESARRFFQAIATVWSLVIVIDTVWTILATSSWERSPRVARRLRTSPSLRAKYNAYRRCVWAEVGITVGLVGPVVGLVVADRVWAPTALTALAVAGLVLIRLFRGELKAELGIPPLIDRELLGSVSHIPGAPGMIRALINDRGVVGPPTVLFWGAVAGTFASVITFAVFDGRAEAAEILQSLNREKVTVEPNPAPPTTTPTTSPRTEPRQPTDSRPSSYEVRPGDNFWAVAQGTLRTFLGREPSLLEVISYWHALVSANSDLLVRPEDPDLVLPGQVIELPRPLANKGQPSETSTRRLTSPLD